ncbi:hypothetical protein Hanom_Chr14g01299711 [Helianthus anomalus]
MTNIQPEFAWIINYATALSKASLTASVVGKAGIAPLSVTFAPCGEQNGKTNNLDGVRGREQTGKKPKHQGVKWLFLKVWSKTVKVTKPQGAKRKFTLIILKYVNKFIKY